MLNFIDSLLNKITMYRLVLYYLIVLLAVAAIFGAFGIMPYDPVSLLVSALILIVACWSANRALAKLFHAQTNSESSLITALILAVVITPIKLVPLDINGFWFLIAAAVFAMGSKYILAIHKKHIFNPAAIAVALTAIFLGQYASWWVCGNVQMVAFVVIGGLLITRKLQRFDLVVAFVIAAVVSIVLTSLAFDPVTSAEKAIVHTSLLFFAFVMLTEPLTTPPTRGLRIAYGVFVGALFAPAIHIGPIYSTPELALVVGNIFSYAVSPRRNYRLSLASKEENGEGVYDFAFAVGDGNARGAAAVVAAADGQQAAVRDVLGQKINFQPGQYMEFTLAHADPDSRGNRRYFTIASSPTEPELRLGVKFYEKSSSFKRKMLTLEPGDVMMGGSLAGDFTLPNDPGRKLVFVAGGIGITPFRSMVKFLSDYATTHPSEEKPDVVLLYSNHSAAEISYSEIFDEAEETIGLRTIYAITDEYARPDHHLHPGHHRHAGRINAALIMSEVPDYRERIFYISGTHAMVVAFTKTLHELGIPLMHIKTDFFPGFA